MRLILVAACWIVFSVLTLRGQATAATEFEVASVKPADKQDRDRLSFLPGRAAEMMNFEGGPGTKDPGRIFYHGVSLKALLAHAYSVRPDQISGPSWLGSERYTIEAKLSPDGNKDQLRLMLQKLLTERFQMSLHKEVKETPVYRLKIAKTGPKLQPAEDLPHYDSEEERRSALEKQVRENMAKMAATREANARAGIPTPSRSFGMLRATTEKFAEALSGYLDRPVKDMTQLEGEYRFRLSWTPDNSQHDEPSELSIFVAIQEQLGLKLEAGNEAIELVVIDKVEKTPASN